jgi:hypothetical protein
MPICGPFCVLVTAEYVPLIEELDLDSTGNPDGRCLD